MNERSETPKAECICENPAACSTCQNELAAHFAERELEEQRLGREAGARVMAKIRAEYQQEAEERCPVCGCELDAPGSCPRDCKVMSDDLPDGALA